MCQHFKCKRNSKGTPGTIANKGSSNHVEKLVSGVALGGDK